MNRAQRRQMRKSIKAKNIQINPGVEKIDRTNDKWCFMHNLKLDNVSPQTERDKRLIASVEYRTVKVPQEDGTTKVMKQCPRCFRTIEIGKIQPSLLR